MRFFRLVGRFFRNGAAPGNQSGKGTNPVALAFAADSSRVLASVSMTAIVFSSFPIPTNTNTNTNTNASTNQTGTDSTPDVKPTTVTPSPRDSLGSTDPPPTAFSSDAPTTSTAPTSISAWTPSPDGCLKMTILDLKAARDRVRAQNDILAATRYPSDATNRPEPDTEDHAGRKMSVQELWRAENTTRLEGFLYEAKQQGIRRRREEDGRSRLRGVDTSGPSMLNRLE